MLYPPRRLIARAAVLAALLLPAAAKPSQPIARQATAATTPGWQLADNPLVPIAHLRKLHLVRPDLIPYPIPYQFLC